LPRFSLVSSFAAKAFILNGFNLRTASNLSNRQIAQELDLNEEDIQVMTDQLRSGLVAKTPAVRLEGTVEIDEVYVIAGHKGNPAAAVVKKTRAAKLAAGRRVVRVLRGMPPDCGGSGSAGPWRGGAAFSKFTFPHLALPRWSSCPVFAGRSSRPTMIGHPASE
jgi:hypothetical protein